MSWGNSGSNFYICNIDGNVYQYTVNTPYDITTLVDTPTSFSVFPEEATPQGVEFKPDGTRMYICGNDNHITQYTLSTPWNVTSAGSAVDGTLDYNGWSTGGMHFNSTGTKVYLVFHNGGSTCYLFAQSLNTAWDITSIQADGTFVNISSDTGEGTGIHLSDDGTLLHVSSNDTGNDFVLQYLLSTPFDENTGTLDFTYDSSVLDISVESVTFDDTGYILYILGRDTGTVYQIPLTG